MHVYIYIYIYILHSCSRYLFLSAALSVSLYISLACLQCFKQLTPVGFEPTQLALVELESTPLDHSGKVSMCLSLGIAVSSISFFSTHTRPRLNNNNKHKRYTMARLYPQIFFRNEELCQWLVGHVPGIEGSGHCGSTLLWAFVSLGAAQPTIHAFFTHTRPHRTTTNTRDTPCPSSTLGKIFE